MIEYKVAGKLKNGELFSIKLMAYDVWHAMNKAKFVVGPIKGCSAFKAGN